MKSLALLPEPELTIVHMRIHHEKVFQDIADALHQSIGYVHSHWTNACTLVRRNMQRADGSEDGNE